MQYRADLKSGNELSALGLGTMRFPRGINMRIDFAKSEKLVVSAVEKGVNFFDTAYAYGGSEQVLGSILYKNSLREKVYIATKLPFNRCNDYGDFDKFFSEQLKRLKTDYIDYYLIHNISTAVQWETLAGMGIEAWINEKKTGGKIGRIGFSFHGAQSEFLLLLDAYDWDFCYIQYNYLNENYQAGIKGLKAANKKGLPVIIMEPLLGGRLATGLPKKAKRIFNQANRSISHAAWALRWLWNQPEVTVVLSGMSNEEQLADNIKTAEIITPGSMNKTETDVYKPVIAAFKEAYKIDCTGCNYCMPCQMGINIPECFAAYNATYAVGFISGMTQYVTSTGVNRRENNHSGKNCNKCGVCEPNCPQNINIIKSLEKITKKMEPFWFKTALKIISKFI